MPQKNAQKKTQIIPQKKHQKNTNHTTKKSKKKITPQKKTQKTQIIPQKKHKSYHKKKHKKNTNHTTKKTHKNDHKSYHKKNTKNEKKQGHCSCFFLCFFCGMICGVCYSAGADANLYIMSLPEASISPIFPSPPQTISEGNALFCWASGRSSTQRNPPPLQLTSSWSCQILEAVGAEAENIKQLAVDTSMLHKVAASTWSPKACFSKNKGGGKKC